MTVMSMTIGDIHFSVREATLYGNIADSNGVPPGLSWYVTVQTATQPIKVRMLDADLTDEEISVQLCLSCEFQSDPMRSWSELEGKTVHSNLAESPPFPAAFSYFETHERMPYSTLKFVKRTGNEFQLHWEGKCHPMFGEPYNKDVPFLVQTEATFDGIGVRLNRRDTEATARLRLPTYLDPSEFIQHPIKETVHDLPVEHTGNIFERRLRWLFNSPKRVTSRLGKFEPRI